MIFRIPKRMKILEYFFNLFSKFYLLACTVVNTEIAVVDCGANAYIGEAKSDRKCKIYYF